MRYGFINAVKEILSIREDGLAVGGPPCGPWIFINSATHCRKKNPESGSIFGDTSKEYVRSSNMYLSLKRNFQQSEHESIIHVTTPPIDPKFGMLRDLRLVCRWAMLLLLAGVRCVYTMTEQPSSSLMPHYDYIKYIRTMFAVVLKSNWTNAFLPEP